MCCPTNSSGAQVAQVHGTQFSTCYVPVQLDPTCVVGTQCFAGNDTCGDGVSACCPDPNAGDRLRCCIGDPQGAFHGNYSECCGTRGGVCMNSQSNLVACKQLAAGSAEDYGCQVNYDWLPVVPCGNGFCPAGFNAGQLSVCCGNNATCCVDGGKCVYSEWDGTYSCSYPRSSVQEKKQKSALLLNEKTQKSALYFVESVDDNACDFRCHRRCCQNVCCTGASVCCTAGCCDGNVCCSDEDGGCCPSQTVCTSSICASNGTSALPWSAYQPMGSF